MFSVSWVICIHRHTGIAESVNYPLWSGTVLVFVRSMTLASRHSLHHRFQCDSSHHLTAVEIWDAILTAPEKVQVCSVQENTICSTFAGPGVRCQAVATSTRAVICSRRVDTHHLTVAVVHSTLIDICISTTQQARLLQRNRATFHIRNVIWHKSRQKSSSCHV